MLLIEFNSNLDEDNNIVKYRNIDETEWKYLYCDINYGIMIAKQYNKITNLDNGCSLDETNIKYCEADILLKCNKKINKKLMVYNAMEQRY